MNTNTAIKILASALLLGLGLLFLFWKGGGGEAPGERREIAGPSEAASAQELAPLEQVDEPAAPTGERVEARSSLEEVIAAPWQGELAGLVGRVVEADGTPVPEIRVSLLQFDTEILFGPELFGPEEPELSLELEETITDEEGRFLLGGARATAFHGLGVDLGGDRSTLRVLDSALVHGERTDVGDVVLAPYGVLTGRIVDEGGLGVAGARIRVGPFPEEILMGSPWEMREESLIAISMLLGEGGGQGVIELPGWVLNQLDDLPVPTRSSETGSFRLEGVPLDRVVGGIDRPGFAGISLGPIDMSGGGEKDLGDLVLTRGRTIEGVVEDAEGYPLAGLEVHAGAEVPAGFVAILQPCGATDEEGRFRLSGVPGDGQVVAVTRRSKSEPWSSEVSAQHDDMLLSLEPAIQLCVLVQDEEGAALSDALIRLEPDRGEERMMGFDEALRFLPRDPDPINGFREVEPGRYVNPSLTPGAYELTVRVTGRALGRLRAEIRNQESELVVVCPRGDHIELSVVDATSQEPVGKARARILSAGGSGFSPLASALTDQAGRARLGPIAEDEQGREGVMPQETILVVRHPRYADHSVTLEPGTAQLAVALESGGALAGKVHWDGAVPTRLYMLMVQDRGGDGFIEMFQMPRFGLSDFNGAFRIENLSGGEYRVELFERFLDRDPLGFIGEDFEPANLYSETVTIEKGRTTELVINLTATGRGPTARLRGRVRVDGRDIEGAEVQVRGNGSLTVLTDVWGRFETEEFPVRDRVWVSIAGDVALPSGTTQRVQIYRESLEIQEGELRELEVDLYPLELRVEVVDALTGDAIAGAEVEARPKKGGSTSGQVFSGEYTTDDRGEATLWVSGAGEYRVTAGAEGFGGAQASLEVPETGQSGLARLELPRAVPCAGRVLVTGATEGEVRFSYVWAQSEDDLQSDGTMIRPPDFEFEFDGLSAGKFSAYTYVNGQRGEQTSFELGPDGDRNLLIEYVPTQD